MITIGIGAYREEKTISFTIDAIMKQRIKEPFEIIIACPDEETTSVIRNLAVKNKKIRLVKEQKREGQPAAYNKIIKAAKGKIIIFTDADATLEKGAINKIIDAYRDKRVGAAGGRPYPINDRTTKFGFWAHFLFYSGHIMRLMQSVSNDFYYIPGPLCSIRKGIITEIPLNALATDAVLGLSIKSKGWKVAYVPEAVVYQKAPTNLSDFFKQKRRTMAGFYQLKKWFPNVPSRSLGSEAKYGFVSGLKYARNSIEKIWFLELAFYRVIAWLLAFYDIQIKKKSLVELWKPIESSK